jgi:hypothetical protein
MSGDQDRESAQIVARKHGHAMKDRQRWRFRHTVRCHDDP